MNPGPEVMKPFFMLNSAEHEILNSHVTMKIPRNSAFFRLRKAKNAIFYVNKCLFANSCWHFNIYEQKKFHPQLS